MKETIKMWSSIAIVLIAIIGIWLLAIHFTPTRKTPDEVILEKITQIENKIDSLSIRKDSIKTYKN